MAAGKVFAISFAINAALGASFSTAMNQGAAVMKRLGDETRFINAEQRRLDRLWKNSQQQVRGYADQVRQLQSQYDRGRITESQYQMSLGQLTQKMRAAGMSAEEYRGHLRRLQGDLERTKAATQRMQEAQAAQMTASAKAASARAGFMSSLATAGMISAPFIDMTHTALDFQAAMSKVQALTNASAEDVQRLTDKARELGRTTRFTARESADAMSYLGMAGWKTEQILAGMGPMLSLAAAGGTDLARTADILSDDLTAFGLSANDAGRMADVFAYTISNSNTTVELMGETMKYAAPVARAFGATMEETAALTAMMASAGIKGSQAGTSLRQGFLRLAGPPRKAAKELEALGINLSDAQREMQETQATLRGLGIEMDDSLPPQQKMVAIIRQLADKTRGLKDEQKLSALQAIFGTTAASGWLNVINAGPEALEKFVTALNNCDGESRRMEKTMTDNAQGALIAMKSAVEDVSIAVGNAFLPMVGEGAKIVAEFARSASEWATNNQTLISTLGGVAAGVGASYLGYKGFAAIYTTVAAEVSSARLALETFSQTEAGGRVVASAKDSAAKIADAFRPIFRADTWKAWGDEAANAFKRVRAITWADVGSGIKNGVKSGTTAAANYLTALRTSALATATSVKASLMNLPAMLGNMGGAAAGKLKAFSLSGLFSGMASGMSALVSTVFSPMGIAIAAIAGAAYLLYKNWDKVGPFFVELWGRIQKSLSDAWIAMQPAIAALQTALWNLWAVIGQQLASAWQSIQQAMADNSGTIDILMTAFSTIAQFLGGVVVGAFIVAANVMAGVITTAVGIISGVITSLIGVMTGIIEFITGVFAGDWGRAWEGIVKIFESIFGGIKKFAESILNGVASTINGISTSVSKFFSFGSPDGGTPVSANAAGGIYRKGAFLTTFAEEGPEAAIPLDGSRRALGLWQKAGEILGVGQGAESSIRFGSPASTSISAPPISINVTINGDTSPDGVREAVLDAGREAQASFAEQIAAFLHEKERVTYA